MLPLLLVSSVLPGVATAQKAACSPVAADQLASQTQVPFGEIITNCTQPNTFALTFDDGPFNFTAELLTTLRKAGVRATFFINGKNKANIEDFSGILNRMLCDGHQIGSHTFDHKDLVLDGLSESDIVKEMTDLDDKLLLQNSIQMKPTYMRPPFFSTNETVLAIMKRLEYHVVQSSVDTKDFEFSTEETNGQAVTKFQNELDAGGSISLMHDIFPTTVSLLVPQALEILRQKQMKLVTVGECLGDAKQNWYRLPPGMTGGNINGKNCRRRNRNGRKFKNGQSFQSNGTTNVVTRRETGDGSETERSQSPELNGEIKTDGKPEGERQEDEKPKEEDKTKKKEEEDDKTKKKEEEDNKTKKKEEDDKTERKEEDKPKEDDKIKTESGKTPEPDESKKDEKQKEDQKLKEEEKLKGTDKNGTGSTITPKLNGTKIDQDSGKGGKNRTEIPGTRKSALQQQNEGGYSLRKGTRPAAANETR
ncbi:hypothetical protein XA68_17509 [Ophiocordyceps unilateralis]|uniref:NodB homology domain-containing protein n=1 Tax=Ophiocordyceps unilateralis TaxID=268505 RepID=A0A2A9P4H0_OPHUN|nr:hypothetical protein XA68_17509 [Ophiocordyceps unilateralis]